jgi:hypothetical protein
VKVTFTILRPWLSAQLLERLRYTDSLAMLFDNIDREQMKIPSQIYQYVNFPSQANTFQSQSTLLSCYFQFVTTGLIAKKMDLRMAMTILPTKDSKPLLCFSCLSSSILNSYANDTSLLFFIYQAMYFVPGQLILTFFLIDNETNVFVCFNIFAHVIKKSDI